MPSSAALPGRAKRLVKGSGIRHAQCILQCCMLVKDVLQITCAWAISHHWRALSFNIALMQCNSGQGLVFPARRICTRHA